MEGGWLTDTVGRQVSMGVNEGGLAAEPPLRGNASSSDADAPEDLTTASVRGALAWMPQERARSGFPFPRLLGLWESGTGNV